MIPTICIALKVNPNVNYGLGVTRVQSLGQKDPLENPLQDSCLENPMDRGG